jgi:hypothetical protein
MKRIIIRCNEWPMGNFFTSTTIALGTSGAQLLSALAYLYFE